MEEKNMKYDYLCSRCRSFRRRIFLMKLKKEEKTCLVIDRRNHIAGNIYCENVQGITYTTYGAHIFHTSNKEVWELRESVCRIQQLYQFSGGCLQG